MKIYGSRFSPRARRAAIAAAETGAPIELVELNPGKGENQTPAYLAKNPMGKLPTFEDDDGWCLWESGAILVYLADKYPEQGLLPREPRARAEALRWMFWCVAHLDSSIGPLYFERFLVPLRKQAPNEAVVSAALKELGRYMPVLEKHLSEHSWMLGTQFSMVDVMVGAGVDALLLPEVAFDKASIPKTVAWHAKLAQRPSWRAFALR